MPKQLSRCCKAEIELTGEDRPNHFKCGECSRIIGEPYEIKYVSAYDLNNPREIPGGYVCDKINELIDAVNNIQDKIHARTVGKEFNKIGGKLTTCHRCNNYPETCLCCYDCGAYRKSDCSCTGNDIDVPSTSSVNYGKTPTPHTITDTATDTNVGAKIGNTDFSKISYSKEAVEQEAEDLMRESDAFRAGIQFAVEGFEKKEDEYISWQECVDERKKEMKSIYQD